MKIGSTAPQFALQDKDEQTHSLSRIPGEYTVLYFYPKDDTPGCTLEAQAFSKALQKFARHKATVVGISGGDSKSKSKFCSKHKLKVLLLSDPDFSVSKKYQSYGKKLFMGKTYDGILRNTFVLDRAKRVIAVFEKVDPATHAEQVLAFLKDHAAATKEKPAKPLKSARPVQRPTQRKFASASGSLSAVPAKETQKRVAKPKTVGTGTQPSKRTTSSRSKPNAVKIVAPTKKRSGR